MDHNGLKYNIARLFNCVGPGKTNYVLSDLTTKIIAGQHPLEILGDGKSIRSFIHGKDIGRAIRLMITGKNNECFNVSTNEHTSILELVKKIWSQFYGSADSFSYVLKPISGNDVTNSVADVSKAEKELGFSAKITIDETIKEILKKY